MAELGDSARPLAEYGNVHAARLRMLGADHTQTLSAESEPRSTGP
jgi:hypothetical protein